MHNLSINELRAFTTVVDVGGFTQAGRLLGRSQPTISLQIKRLEEQIGALLFVRKGKVLELTSSGSRLRKYALEILALNDAIIKDFKQPALTGRVSLGIPSEFATTLLPKILGLFTQSHPSVNLEIKCALSKELLSQKRSEYDLILALDEKIFNKAASFLRQEELVWVGDPNHDVIAKQPLNLVLAPEPCIYRARALERLEATGQSSKITYTNNDLAGIQTAIQEGLGVTILAKSTVPQSMKILRNPVKYPSLGSVGIHLHYDRKTANGALRRLVEYIRISI